MCCAELSSCCDTDILDQLRMELIFTHFSYLEQQALVGPKERSNKPSVFSTHQSKLTNLHVITKAGLPREKKKLEQLLVRFTVTDLAF